MTHGRDFEIRYVLGNIGALKARTLTLLVRD